MQRLDPTLNNGSTQYIDGNPNTGVGGTVLQAAALQSLQEELANIVLDAGGTLDPNNNTQVMTKIKQWISIAIGGLNNIDKYVQGFSSYNAATNTLNLAMSDGTVVAIDATALITDAVASMGSDPSKVSVGSAYATLAGKAINIAAGTNLQTWADSLPPSGLYNIIGSALQDGLPAGMWYIDLRRHDNDTTVNNWRLMEARSLNDGAAYQNVCHGGVWTGWLPLSAASVAAANTVAAEYLSIAGGAAGGDGSSTGYGGGGGHGGYRTNVAGQQSGGGASAEPPLFLARNTSYPVVVGAGGSNVYVTKGGDSSFAGIVSLGGGIGANATQPQSAKNGGGGGGGNNNSPAVGSGTAGQGYSGGAGSPSYGSGAGGGGAGGPGGSVTAADVGGNGGPGLSSNITGSSVPRAGGGGGHGVNGEGIGGLGGGGSADGTVRSGAPNTGSGGAGFTYGGGIGAGGSGVVIIKVPVAAGATGGTVTTVGAFTVHTFTTSGTLVIN